MTKEEIVEEIQTMMKKVDEEITSTLSKFNEGKGRTVVDIFFVPNVDLPDNYVGIKGKYFAPRIVIDLDFVE